MANDRQKANTFCNEFRDILKLLLISESLQGGCAFTPTTLNSAFAISIPKLSKKLMSFS